MTMNFTYKILLYFLFVLLALLFIGGSSIDTNTLLITGFVAALGILFVLPTKEDAETTSSASIWFNTAAISCKTSSSYRMFAVASMNPMIGWILLGYFLLAGNIAAEKWLLASYDFKEINFITAAVIMGLTAFQEFAQHRSFDRLKPVHWPTHYCSASAPSLPGIATFIPCWGSLFFEFGAIGLLSPVVMACLAIPILRERPSRILLWFALLLGLTGGFFLVKGDWNGLGEWHYHAVMFLALVFASLRWILVKSFGDRILLPALIFWEPLLVLITTGLIIDLSTLWDKATLGLFSAALLKISLAPVSGSLLSIQADQSNLNLFFGLHETWLGHAIRLQTDLGNRSQLVGVAWYWPNHSQ